MRVGNVAYANWCMSCSAETTHQEDIIARKIVIESGSTTIEGKQKVSSCKRDTFCTKISLLRFANTFHFLQMKKSWCTEFNSFPPFIFPFLSLSEDIMEFLTASSVSYRGPKSGSYSYVDIAVNRFITISLRNSDRYVIMWSCRLLYNDDGYQITFGCFHFF